MSENKNKEIIENIENDTKWDDGTLGRDEEFARKVDPETAKKVNELMPTKNCQH